MEEKKEKTTKKRRGERRLREVASGSTFGRGGVVDVGFGIEDFDEDVEEARVLHQRGNTLRRRPRFPFVDAHLVLQLEQKRVHQLRITCPPPPRDADARQHWRNTPRTRTRTTAHAHATAHTKVVQATGKVNK